MRQCEDGYVEPQEANLSEVKKYERQPYKECMWWLSISSVRYFRSDFPTYYWCLQSQRCTGNFEEWISRQQSWWTIEHWTSISLMRLENAKIKEIEDMGYYISKNLGSCKLGCTDAAPRLAHQRPTRRRRRDAADRAFEPCRATWRFPNRADAAEIGADASEIGPTRSVSTETAESDWNSKKKKKRCKMHRLT